MDQHLLIEGAAAIILVIVGGFFVIAAWRAYARAGMALAPPAPVGRAELVPIIGIPLFGLVLLLTLIALASAGGAPGHPDGHGAHGWAPDAAWGHRRG